MLRLLLLLLVCITDFSRSQFYGQPTYYYQPQPIVTPLSMQSPINYFQTVPIAPSYQHYPQYHQYPFQYDLHQPAYVNSYPTNYPVNMQTTNNLANYLLIRELENSRGGNEFRDREGTFEEPNRLINSLSPVGPAEHSKYLSLISDKDNFQVSGCSWDLVQMKCVDGLGLCKGGCRDFGVSSTATLHDCRCIPYGYAALLKLAGK